MDSARSLVYVGETRWYTHHLCIQRLLENKKAIVQLVDTSVFDRIDSSKKRAVLELIRDNSFWTKLASVETDLRPTSKCIGILEADICCLSGVYRCFVEMTADYRNNPRILPLIESRWAFVHTESMSMAFFLDPRTRGGLDMLGDDHMEA
jgi:hypothetical protein